MLDAATQWVTQASPPAFWIALLTATGLAVAAFVYTFVFLRRVRVIEDTPTARIRSAAQGYGELAGLAQLMDGVPIVAPLTGKTCAWYRYKVEKMGDKHTHVVDSGSSDELFLLLGRTGRCVIDPEGATVITRHKEVWFDYSYPSRKRGGRSGLLGQLLGRVGSRYRYTEERLRAGEPLYAIGMFKSVGGGAESFNTEEEVRALLRAWKSDKARLLKDFDANGDGDIDLQEWEAVRKAAYRQVRKEQSQRSVEPPTHVMSKPVHGSRPYLLSALSEEELVKRFRLSAAGSLAAFLLLGSAAVWMMAVRFHF